MSIEDSLVDDAEIMRRSSPSSLISIVVPMYNEEEGLQTLLSRLIPALEQLHCCFEVVCVNDGSQDNTWSALRKLRASDPRFKIINLSRNFGKESALTAGLEHATGDAVIPIDADLQDPPEIIGSLVAKWCEGYDTVVGVRNDRRKDSFLKRVTASMFYKLFGRISDVRVIANAGDFRLLDRRVVEAVKLLPEQSRFMKGLFAWVGFRSAIVEFARDERAVGAGKWTSWKLWNFALDGVFSFSTLPLRIWTYLGALIAITAVCYMVYIITKTVLMGSDLPGYPSLAAIMLFSTGVQLTGIGMLGEYIGRIFMEVKRRPLYLASDKEGFDDSAITPQVVAKDVQLNVG